MGNWRGFVGLLLLLGCAPSFAITYKEQFCAKTNSQLLEQSIKPENRLSFRNPSGFLDMGVCWWHSRFERASNYLAIFIPSQPKPTAKIAREIISKLITRKQVVVIPGYKNLHEFSEAYRGTLVTALSKWQLKDGLINQFWYINITANSSLTPSQMKARMDQIYAKFKNTNMLTTIVLKGTAVMHMWNIADMTPTVEGYKLTITDSNIIKEPKIIFYANGDTTLFDTTPPESQYVPELFLNDLDLNRIIKTREEFCK